MFAKSKVSQSMIDAVNKVLGEQPVQPAQPVQPVGVKEELLNEGWDDMVKDAKEKMKSGPKPSGGAGKKEGSRYGGSKQKDEKPVKEELKGSQHKIDKNKNNKIDAEDFKLLRKEELKGSQHKIDANNNNKIDGQDFAILRGKKKMREHLNDMPFAKKLLEKELDEGLMKKAFKALTGGSDEDQRKDLQRKMGVPQTGEKPESEIKYAAKTLVKHAKDPLGLKKEEVEQIDELKKSTLSSYAKKATDDVSYHSFSAGTRSAKDPERLKDDEKAMKRQSGVNKAIDRLAKEEVEQIDELSKSTLSSYLDKKKSEYMKGKTPSGSKENAKDIQNMGKAHDKMRKEEADITTDGLAGRKDGGAENTFNLFKKKLQGDVAPNPKEDDKPEETAARKSKIPHPPNTQSPQEVDNLDKKYGNPNTFKEEKEEPPFDKPYTKTKNFPVTDKSGAIHTPMSRARDLAQRALKKVKDKTKIKN